MVRVEDEQDAGLRFHYPTMMQVGCTLYVTYTKFYHEEFAMKARAGNASMSAEFGVKLVALDLR